MGLVANSNTPVNISETLNEKFSSYSAGTTWTEVKGTGDIIQLDGNTVGASYVVISKNPLVTGTESSLTSIQLVQPNVEVAAGIHLSQRVLGQEFYYEVVSNETPDSAKTDLAISGITQSTTTVTITTTLSHGLVAGDRIGTYGVSDSRFNYPNLVVAAVVSPTSFTCTAGAGGTIPSVTAGPFASGYVYFRSPTGYAKEGISEAFENASATNASLYVRVNGDSPIPTGTYIGNQSVSVATTASNQAAAAAYAYAFQPSSEFRFLMQADKVQAYHMSVDTTSTASTAMLRTQIVPSVTKNYNIRFRADNTKGMVIPNAQIVSAVKTGTTTATITTDVAHGYNAADQVVIYGIRDTTNFANLTTATTVSSIVNSTTFTVVIGAAASTTSYGGLVARAQGGNTIGGVLAQTIQSASATSTIISLTGSVAWTGAVAGDYVNIYGCRNALDGSTMSIDGVYRVQNVSTTLLTLEPIGGTATVADFGTTNCGGTVIKRTDLRLSFVRATKFERERVEILPKPATDQGGSMSVYMTGGTLGSGTISTLSNGFLAFNQSSADIASGAITTSNTSAAITPTAGALTHEFNMIVTAVSGTPTLDWVIQESDDAGTNWYDVYHFPRITATGQYRSPLLPLTGNRVRYIRTVGGGTPSITASINRLQSHTIAPIQRQFFDRALVVNTISSVTSSFFIEGCNDLNLMVSMGAVTTTAPVLVLEISPDNSTWVQVGADVTTAASTNNLLQVTNALGRFARVRVKTAGSGATMNFLMVKGIGR